MLSLGFDISKSGVGRSKTWLFLAKATHLSLNKKQQWNALRFFIVFNVA